MAKKKTAVSKPVVEETIPCATLAEENQLLAQESEKDDDSVMAMVPFGGLLTTAQLSTLTSKTPDKYIYKRQGRGGTTLDYVSIGYVVHVLNKVFNSHGWGWSFDIEEVSNMEMVAKTGNIVVKGRLTITGPNALTRVIQQYGSAEVKLHRNGDRAGRPVDIGDDYKSAGSDALKKCASLIGVANDVYFRDWGAFQESREDAPQETPTATPTPINAEVVDDATTQARRRIFEQVKSMFNGDKNKMVEFLKDVVGKDSFMSLDSNDMARLDQLILEPGEMGSSANGKHS